MKKDYNENSETKNEEIMNRVNQTFDKIAEDVKDMINNNGEASDQDHTLTPAMAFLSFQKNSIPNNGMPCLLTQHLETSLENE